MSVSEYIGRFAPTPSGPLHFGSLLAALASYLDAKANNGTWLVRIENLDPRREDAVAGQNIPYILESYGLHWDGNIRYQSERKDAYQACLNSLIEQQLAFPCQCSRKQLNNQPHLGNCHCQATTDIAWRFLCPAEEYCFLDRVQGWHCENYRLLGDFVLKRRDGPWSYQLAVVCDDIDQGVTHIVRGVDLIDSSARQALLYKAFGQPLPSYAHIPIAVEADGQKLSKQNLALPLCTDNVAATLFKALRWLRQEPPDELKNSPIELLAWAEKHWRLEALKGLHDSPAPEDFQH